MPSATTSSQTSREATILSKSSSSSGHLDSWDVGHGRDWRCGGRGRRHADGAASQATQFTAEAHHPRNRWMMKRTPCRRPLTHKSTRRNSPNHYADIESESRRGSSARLEAKVHREFYRCSLRLRYSAKSGSGLIRRTEERRRYFAYGSAGRARLGLCRIRALF